MPHIKLETIIHAPADRCCALSLQAEIHLDSLSHTGERVVAGRSSGQFELGDTVTWEARHLGFTQQLQVRITVLDFPAHFRDEMIRGIFRVMQHDHYFREVDGVTTMTDEFYYEAPLGLLGRLADLLFLKSYMRALLLQRNTCIRKIAESE